MDELSNADFLLKLRFGSILKTYLYLIIYISNKY